MIAAQHCAPLQPEVVWVYLGLGLLLTGLVSALTPLRFLGIRRRATALLVLAIGAAFVLGGFEWPASSRVATGPHQRLDDFMPTYEFYERHGTCARASVARVSDAVKSVTAADMRIIGTDDHARRTFARYWRMIYPGSAIIRRAWLDAIVARAEHGAGD